jgi:hypothetical protein
MRESQQRGEKPVLRPMRNIDCSPRRADAPRGSTRGTGSRPTIGENEGRHL